MNNQTNLVLCRIFFIYLWFGHSYMWLQWRVSASS